jgi:hypothetical protein
MDGEDIWMNGLGDRPGMAFESRKTVGVVNRFLIRHLDRHFSIQPLIMRPEKFSQPALADFLDLDLVSEGATDKVTQC